jgi:hypothetical protein
LLVGLLPMLASSPALAAPAAPGDLTPDSTTIGGQPVLDWSRVDGAEEYDVQVASSPDFTTTLYDETTENSRATPTSNLPAGTLFWRVRGVTASNVHGAWADASFDHSAAAGPTSLTPSDGADLQQPDDSPLLTWTPVNGATSYTLQVDNDDLFADPTTTYTSKTTAYTLEDTGPEQTYYWRVLANFSGNLTSDWSEVRTFNVLALPSPDLISPDDSSTTQVQDAALDWAPVPGAVKYEVRVSTDDQFNTLIDSATVKSTRYAKPVTYDNDQYWWEVRAIDANGNKSPWSTSLNQFQRNWPDRPTLVYPTNGSTPSMPLYYQWDGVPHASTYQLEVGDDPNFSPNTYDVCLTKDTTFTPGKPLGKCGSAGVITYWRVRPIDAPQDVNGLYSVIYHYSYGLDEVTVTGPDNGDLVAGPDLVLSWDAYENTEKYRVVLKQDDGSTVANVITYSTSWSPTGSVRMNPADGPFHYTVSALIKDGTASPIPSFGSLGDHTFNVPATTDVVDDPLVSALTPTSPDGQHTARFPSLTWEPYFEGDGTPAAYYRIFVAHASNPGIVQDLGSTFPYASGTDISEDFLNADDWVWHVQAYRSNGTLLGSGPTASYTIDELAPVTGMRLSLDGQGLESSDTTCARDLPADPAPTDVCNNLQQTPVLRWDVDPDAGLYMVYLSHDRELTNLETVDSTANTMWTPTDQLPDSQAGTAYYWFVRPCKTATVCAPDPTEATNAFDKRSNPISGLVEAEHDSSATLPAHGPGGVSDPPDFADEVVLSWDDYLLTSQAGNDVDVTGMPSQVEAQSYKVQISSDPNFASGFLHTSQLIDQTTYTPYNTTLPEGPLYWRVQAVDGSGNALAWSLSRAISGATQSIEKVSPTPTLVGPVGEEIVTGTPAFAWDPLNYAAKYEIQIARHNDTTFSTGNRAVADTTTQTTYVPSVTLPTSGNPYVWRVRRIDVDNRAAGWSTVGEFSVDTQAPSQVSPAADVYVPGKDSLFTWQPVDGAASYRIERRIVGASSVQENRSTTGLAWAPLSHIPDGRYEWRVSAYDQGNSLMGSSPWRPFKVDETPPTVTHKTPTSIGTPKTVVQVDFSERVRGVDSGTFKIFLEGNAAALPATVTATNHHKSAKLDPANNLKVGKTYTIKLLSGIKDLAGHSLKPVIWSITIEKG